MIEDLKWAGIDWDEGPDKPGPLGPYIQSERLPIYKKWIKALFEIDHAYPCFCTTERLAQLREEQSHL